MNAANSPADDRRVSTTVARLAALMKPGGLLSTGEVAELRRMDPARPAPGFFKLEGAVLDADLPAEAGRREERETRWAAVVAGLAILGELHRPERRLGTALAEAGFTPVRFARLIRADDDSLPDQLLTLARFMAAKGVQADWTHAAWLLTSVDAGSLESVRRHLARDYYGALERSGGR